MQISRYGPEATSIEKLMDRLANADIDPDLRQSVLATINRYAKTLLLLQRLEIDIYMVLL